MNTMNLDKEKIKKTTGANHTATVTMIMLGFRQRSQATTNLAKLKEKLLQLGEKVVNKDYMNFWKELEEAGAGSIILGRRGKQTRFAWNYSLKDVAKIAIENKQAEVKALAAKQAPVRVKEAVDNVNFVLHPSEPLKQPIKELDVDATLEKLKKLILDSIDTVSKM